MVRSMPTPSDQKLRRAAAELIEHQNARAYLGQRTTPWILAGIVVAAVAAAILWLA
jgi:hypothetical protein